MGDGDFLVSLRRFAYKRELDFDTKITEKVEGMENLNREIETLCF
jgi:hypothetical protein